MSITGSLVFRELPFEPFPLFSGSHPQTILGIFFNWNDEPPSQKRYVTLSDGDKIVIEITTPQHWTPESLTVVMVHGLCGSHRSSYLVRMTKRLMVKGIRCIRFNMRGCGSGKGHAKQMFHSGRSEDLLHTIECLRQEHPFSPIVIMGFSLGANIVLKLAGELGAKAEGLIQQVIAISPPSDLFLSVQHLAQSTGGIYERYFLMLLKNSVKGRHQLFPELEPIKFPKKLTIYQFDEIYTAPQCGFASAMDYYQKCSSKPFVPEIRVPCRILFAEDDPLICSTTLDDIELPGHVRIYKTKKGGHLGFLSTPNMARGFHWMDHLLEEWILDPNFKKEP